MLVSGLTFLGAAADGATSFYSIRPQSEDSARWLSGWTHQVNLWNNEEKYYTIAVTPSISKTHHSADITRSLFGGDLQGCEQGSIKISGSSVATRYRPKEWFADYFGLPPDFQSIISFSPSITNYQVDFNLYVGFDDWLQGAYFNIFGPLVHTRWDLGLSECIIDPGELGYAPGYFNATGAARSQLLHSFTDYVCAEKAPVIEGVVVEPLRKSKMSRSALHKTGFADIQMALGYNIVRDGDYHIGGNLRWVIPTGNKPRGCFLFEPILGNGGFFELGLGFSAHGILWRDVDCQQELGCYIEAWVTHMFSTCQVRSFDLKVNDNSRYMLAENMRTIITDGLNAEGILPPKIPNAQFNSIFAPVANISTLPARVMVTYQADVTVMFNYTNKHIEFDCGLNYWSRRPERIQVREHPIDFELLPGNWALKGDAQVFGFTAIGDPVALSATQSFATINTGTNNPGPQAGNPIITTNPGINNPKKAFSGANLLFDAPASADQIMTSFQPVLLSYRSLAECSSSTHGMSYSAFAHVNYVFDDPCRWYTPYLGIGGKFEMAPDSPDQQCPTLCNAQPLRGFSLCGACFSGTRMQANPSQWSIWCKGGVRFN